MSGPRTVAVCNPAGAGLRPRPAAADQNKAMFDESFEALLTREHPEGGFSARAGGQYRPDSTAWAALALIARGDDTPAITRALDRLASEQLDDGRVAVAADAPEAYWPTPLAILAWAGSPRHAPSMQRAAQFLLRTAGARFENFNGSPLGHDTTIPGWSWTDGAHAWVPPTALAMLALDAAGHGDHDRVARGVDLLLDRMLTGGGWNYGNTVVFGQELHADIESTGAALAALAGRVERAQVESSLELLHQRCASVRTPMALSQALLGLSAWSERPAEAEGWVRQSLDKQNILGAYATPLLGQLLLAGVSEAGISGMTGMRGSTR